jgi:hypothetical protein
MSPKIRQGKTPPRTAAAPARVLKPPRPFTDPAVRPETAPETAPDFEARIERAARYGHSLDRIALPANRPSPSSGPVLQRMKRNKPKKDDGSDKKKQRTLDSFFGKPKPQQANTNQQQPTVNTQPPVPTPSTSTGSNLPSVSSLVTPTNASLIPTPTPTVKPDKQEIETLSNTEKEEEDLSSSTDWREEDRARRLARIKEAHPHLANVPDDWIRRGAHNPGGPPITLLPPVHPGPTQQTQALLKNHPHHHIVDLSTGSYKIHKGKNKPPEPFDIHREGEDMANATMSDVRNYAMLTNAYLASTGPKIATATMRNEKGSLGQQSSKIASKERKAHESVYGKKSVGHVPDSSISGVPYSPMGFMPITSDANAIVGNASGIGLKVYKKGKVGSILVKEKGGQFHHYNLPPIANNANLPITSTTISNTSPSNNNSLPTTSTSSSSSNQTLDDQDEFWGDEDVLRQLLQDEESYTKNLPSTSTSSNSSNQTSDVQDTFWEDEDVLRQLLQAEESHTKPQQQKDKDENL